MSPRYSGRRLVLGAATAALAVALVASAWGVLGGRPEWTPWERPADLPEGGAWSFAFANFTTLTFDEVAGRDVEVRRGALPPKGMPLRELRFRTAAGARCRASDHGAGNGELRVDDEVLPGRAFRVDAAGELAADDVAPSALEQLRDEVDGLRGVSGEGGPAMIEASGRR